MANVEHNILTGAALHEPKGVAAAADNTVYVADGATSGAHKQITPTNRVMVHAAGDFPTASGGVRTLAASTIYQVSGSVSIGSDRLVMSSATQLCGTNALVDGVVTTNSGALITSADSFLMNNLALTCSSGDVFDLNGTGTQITFISQLRIISCDTLGDISAFSLVVLDNILVQAATTTGLSFTGAFGNVRVTQGTYTVAAGIVFDLGVATSDGFSFSNVNIDNASGVTGIDIAASGANINSGGQGLIQNCFFLTTASATAGYVAGDNKWTMKGSPGVPRSTATAQGHIVDSSLTTTFTGTGDGNEKVVNFGTDFVDDTNITRRFTVTNAGRFTYTGDIDIEAFVNVSLFASIAGGATRTYNFYIAKNGTLISSSVNQRDYDGTNPGAAMCASVVSFTVNDYVELFVRAETATTDITLDTVSIKILQVSG